MADAPLTLTSDEMQKFRPAASMPITLTPAQMIEQQEEEELDKLAQAYIDEGERPGRDVRAEVSMMRDAEKYGAETIFMGRPAPKISAAAQVELLSPAKKKRFLKVMQETGKKEKPVRGTFSKTLQRFRRGSNRFDENLDTIMTEVLSAYGKEGETSNKQVRKLQEARRAVDTATGDNWFTEGLLGIAENTPQLAAAVVATLSSGGIPAAMGVIASQTVPDAYADLQNEGFTQNEAKVGGIAVGSVEAGLEFMLKPLDLVVPKKIRSGAVKTARGAIVEWLKTGAKETGEEITQSGARLAGKFVLEKVQEGDVEIDRERQVKTAIKEIPSVAVTSFGIALPGSTATYMLNKKMMDERAVPVDSSRKAFREAGLDVSKEGEYGKVQAREDYLKEIVDAKRIARQAAAPGEQVKAEGRPEEDVRVRDAAQAGEQVRKAKEAEKEVAREDRKKLLQEQSWKQLKVYAKGLDIKVPVTKAELVDKILRVEESKRPPTEPLAEPTVQQTVAAVTESMSPKRADIDEQREILGLDEIPSPDRLSKQQALQSAKAKGMEKNAANLASEVLVAPRALTVEEKASFVVRAQGVKREHRATTEAMAKEQDPALHVLRRGQREKLKDEFDTLTIALRLSGTEAGRLLESQKMRIDEDYDSVTILTRARAEKGKKLTEKEEAGYEAIVAKLESKVTSLERLTKRYRNQLSEDVVATHRKSKTKLGPAQAKQEFDSLANKAEELLRAGCLVS